MRNVRILWAVTFVVALTVLAGPAWGATNYWIGGVDGNWFNVGNWSLGALPTADDRASMEGLNGSTVTIAQPGAVALDLGGWTGGTSGSPSTVLVSGTGTLRTFPYFYNSLYYGVLEQTGGTVTVPGMRLGRWSNPAGGTAYGTYKVSGGTLLPTYNIGADDHANPTYRGKIIDAGIRLGISSYRSGQIHIVGSTASIMCLGGENQDEYGAYEQNSYGTLIVELDAVTAVDGEGFATAGGISTIVCDTSVSALLPASRLGFGTGDDATFNITADSLNPVLDIKGTPPTVTGTKITILTADYIYNGAANDNLALAAGDELYWTLHVENGVQTAAGMDNNGMNGRVYIQYLGGAPNPMVPEPATLTLLGLGAIALIRRRRATR